MVAAVALREDNAFEDVVSASSRQEILARYRHLRNISKRHHSNALDFVSKDSMLHHAGRLGLTVGKMLVLNRMEDMTFAFDLAIHTAPADRSRAIERYARSARLAPDTDEALVLETLRQARFSIIRIERRHDVAGLIVRDIFRTIELWLVDEGLEMSVPDGSALATRLFTPEGFAMTAGVMVPFDRELMKDVFAEAPQLHRKRPSLVADDRRFAEAIYRIAVADGTMEQVILRDAAGDSA